GQDLDTFWSALLTGADGISIIERFPVGDLRVGQGGEIKKLTRAIDWRRVPDSRAARLLVSAADDLCVQAGERPLDVDPARLAVVVGTARGGVEDGERALAGSRGAFPARSTMRPATRSVAGWAPEDRSSRCPRPAPPEPLRLDWAPNSCGAGRRTRWSRAATTSCAVSCCAASTASGPSRASASAP